MNLLSFLVFSPLLGIVILLLIPKTQESWLKFVGFVATLPALILSFIIFFQYRSGADLNQWDERFDWISFKNSHAVWGFIFNQI